MWNSPRMLVVFTFATFLVVGGILALATGSWWLLPAAVGVHAIGTFVVLMVTYRAMESQEKPDPTAEARLDEARAGGERAGEKGPQDDPSGDGPREDEPRMAI